MDDERTQIDAEISKIEIRLFSLKSRRNELAPISQLPPELMMRIFDLVRTTALLGDPLETKKNSSVRSPYSWIVIACVSRHWRHVALEHAELWRHIEPFKSHNLANLMLSRAKGLFDVILDYPTIADEHILSHLVRIRTLRINARNSPEIFSSLGRTAPNLTSLTIHSRKLRILDDYDDRRAYNLTSELPHPFLAGSAPSLEHLVLGHAPISLKNCEWSFQNLKTFNVLLLDWNNVPHIFKGMPNLAILSLGLPAASYPAHTDVRFYFPSLTKLYLLGGYDPCHTHLPYISLPAAATLDVAITLTLADAPEALLQTALSVWENTNFQRIKKVSIISSSTHRPTLEFWSDEDHLLMRVVLQIVLRNVEEIFSSWIDATRLRVSQMRLGVTLAIGLSSPLLCRHVRQAFAGLQQVEEIHILPTTQDIGILRFVTIILDQADGHPFIGLKHLQVEYSTPTSRVWQNLIILASKLEKRSTSFGHGLERLTIVDWSKGSRVTSLEPSGSSFPSKATIEDYFKDVALEVEWKNQEVDLAPPLAHTVHWDY